MGVIGFHKDEVTSILQLVAAILKLGNVEFSHRSNPDGTDGCDISNENGSKVLRYFMCVFVLVFYVPVNNF